MSRNRRLLAQLIKTWAQDHNYNYKISDPDPTDQGVSNTGAYLSWIIKESDSNIDLLSLLDKLEAFLETLSKRKHPDGMYCRQCQDFYEFAEANQPDGTLLCYVCRSNPYR